jgi:methyltransferase (TIGR00027 family)
MPIRVREERTPDGHDAVGDVEQPAAPGHAVHRHVDVVAAARRVQPARDVVAADLRDDWPEALVLAGFESDRPTVWVAEGLLYYLPEAAVHRLLDDMHRLSARGSYLGTDLLNRDHTAELMYYGLQEWNATHQIVSERIESFFSLNPVRMRFSRTR